MAYQDGFYGAADLYVSIPALTPTASLLTYISLLLPVGFQVWNGTDQTRRDVYFWVSHNSPLCFPGLNWK